MIERIVPQQPVALTAHATNGATLGMPPPVAVRNPGSYSRSREISERMREAMPKLQAFVNSATTEPAERHKAAQCIKVAYRNMTTGKWEQAEHDVNAALRSLRSAAPQAAGSA
jgi:hypothetical protein